PVIVSQPDRTKANTQRIPSGPFPLAQEFFAGGIDNGEGSLHDRRPDHPFVEGDVAAQAGCSQRDAAYGFRAGVHAGQGADAFGKEAWAWARGDRGDFRAGGSVDAGYFRPVGARHPDLVIAVAGIVGTGRHLDLLADRAGGRIDAHERAGLIDDQPDAVRTRRNAAFVLGRADLEDLGQRAGLEVDLG